MMSLRSRFQPVRLIGLAALCGGLLTTNACATATSTEPLRPRPVPDLVARVQVQALREAGEPSSGQPANADLLRRVREAAATGASIEVNGRPAPVLPDPSEIAVVFLRWDPARAFAVVIDVLTK